MQYKDKANSMGIRAARISVCKIWEFMPWRNISLLVYYTLEIRGVPLCQLNFYIF